MNQPRSFIREYFIFVIIFKYFSCPAMQPSVCPSIHPSSHPASHPSVHYSILSKQFIIVVIILFKKKKCFKNVCGNRSTCRATVNKISFFSNKLFKIYLKLLSLDRHTARQQRKTKTKPLFV